MAVGSVVQVYVLHDANQRVTCLSLLNMDQTLQTLVSSGNMSLAHQVQCACSGCLRIGHTHICMCTRISFIRAVWDQAVPIHVTGKYP